jgi:thiol:disulfide interchange protein DsbD
MPFMDKLNWAVKYFLPERGKISMKIFMVLLLTASMFQLFSQNSDQVITARFLTSADKLKPGDSYQLAMEIQINQPYHINAQKPSEDFLIPTTLTIDAPEGVALGKFDFPKSHMKKFAFSEKALAVYEGTIHIFTSISIASEFSSPEIVLNGVIGYQACDDQTCLSPAELNITQKFPVVATNETITPINQELFSGREKDRSTVSEESKPTKNSMAAIITEQGWMLAFILVFLAGLALNLTPCVYPLIPITISYFGGQTEGKKGKLLGHAILYVLGMAITYSILGVIAALTGNLFGAALQNPYVLIAIAFVLIALALSMFDLYEIRVPNFLSNFAGGAKQGYFGTFFMGLTVGIVAAPCIGPFVLALLTFVGEKGNVILGFSMFFVLALGLGLPFLLLAVFSGSLHKIPRSGAWMVWVRTIFGFILIAMAIYFLQPLFPNSLLYSLSLALTLLLGGIYLAWIEPTKSSGKIFPVIRNLIGIIFFLLAIILASSGITSYLNEEITENQMVTANNAASGQINWLAFSDEKLAEAVQQNKPVMIDFYADWCLPCIELDKFTFSQPEVIELSRKFYMLKVDLTRANDPVSRELKNRFQIKGVPTLVFLSPQGTELNDLRVVGFLEKEQFLPIMQRVFQ